MSKEKQIEDKDLTTLNTYRNKYYADGNSTEQGMIANAINNILPILVKLKNEGYRKQSEWISVEERLPTWEDGKVLIYTPYGISIAQKTTTNHWKGDNAIPKLITHWMPLPEIPKGGEE